MDAPMRLAYVRKHLHRQEMAPVARTYGGGDSKGYQPECQKDVRGEQNLTANQVFLWTIKTFPSLVFF